MGREATSGEGGALGESWYEVLEVDIDASAKEVQQAYERARKLVDGSSVGGYQMLGGASAKEALEQIERAYAVLGDPRAREEYDVELGLKPAVERYASGIPKEALRFLPPVIEEPPASVIELHPGRRSSEPAPAEETVSEPKPKEPAGSANDTLPVAPAGFVLGEGEINGQVIRMAREHAGITIEELAKATKISKNYLRAIEEQDLERLPARVFLRGFLTQIARVLKLDKVRLADGYLSFSDRFQDS